MVSTELAPLCDLAPLCNLATLSGSLETWDDSFLDPSGSVLEVQPTGLVLLCGPTTFDLTPFLELFTACVSTGLSPLCDPTLMADWEDLALETLLSLEDILGVDVARNLVILLSLAAFSRDDMCYQ